MIEVLLEHEKVESQQHVQRHLGGAGREKHRHHMRCVGVGIRQPHVQREHGRLQCQAHGDETRSDQDRVQVGNIVDTQLHVARFSVPVIM